MAKEKQKDEKVTPTPKKEIFNEVKQKEEKVAPTVKKESSEIEDVLQRKIDELEKLINKKVVAIGECGLDYSEKIDLDQEIVFRKQINLIGAESK